MQSRVATASQPVGTFSWSSDRMENLARDFLLAIGKG